MDEFFRSQQSPRGGEAQMNSSFVSPPRSGPLLPRRFTTESGRVPTLSSITATQRGPEPQPQPQDFTTPTQAMAKVQMLEKKRMDYERLREHKRRFEAEIHKLAEQERQEERELAQMTEDLRFNGNGAAGHQSEPTTPPEYRETSSGFPTLFSRPNRYSMSSLTLNTPPGLFNRPGRSGSQLASPQASIAPSRFAFDDQLPSRSVPGSRRNSDEDEKEEAVRQDPTSHRSTNAMNRYSMPVTRSRTYLADMGLEDSNNTTGFLFGDEDANSGETRAAPQANNSDAFPTLFRQQGYSNMNMTSIGSGQVNGNGSVGTTHSPENSTPVSRPSTIRHSFDMKYFQDNAIPAVPDTPASVVSPPATHVLTTPPKLQQSYSTSDVPSAKSVSSIAANANNHAQQHFHNHNASIGRIPAGAVPTRHSREFSNDTTLANGREGPAYPSISSTLQASAAPFGPAPVQLQTTAPVTATISAPSSVASYQYITQPNFGPNGNHVGSPPAGYPMQLMMSMQNLSLNGVPNGASYSPQNYIGYNALYNTNAGRPMQDSQARVIQSRRQMDSEAMARYNNLPLESVGGTIYTLCKDQHGCRYLQRQLENRQPEQVHMIWLETNQHVVELMTDPFGNYLCQKLFEYCGDEERTVLIQNASEHMVSIALNQHGTRALQKMIEFVTLPVQVTLIIEALRFQVVELIQDLNGNHVIQKCLNKLSAHDAYFIFDAVGNNCIEVGTHRHGCCVLQRCIDHAEGPVKTWLVEQITQNAIVLVQDPFGNYVVQYIIDLNEPAFTEPMVQQFRGRIPMLSKHKFSSNVIEKCLRCASEEAKDMITSELLGPGEMDRLIRDSFANYVIQTALEYSTQFVKHQLVETIRPLLPGIRSTPYGRRIQAKIQAYDNNTSPPSTPGQRTPSDSTKGQIPMRPFPQTHGMTATTMLLPGPQSSDMNGAGTPSRNPYTHNELVIVPTPQTVPSLQVPAHLTPPYLAQAPATLPQPQRIQPPRPPLPRVQPPRAQPPRVQPVPPPTYNGNRAVLAENGSTSWL